MFMEAIGSIIMIGLMARVYNAYKLTCEYLDYQNKLKSEE